LAVVCQQAIRLATDISIDNTFWVTPLQHLIEFIISIPFFYFIDWRIHVFHSKNTYLNKTAKIIAGEYILWTFYFFIWINIYVIIAHRILNLPEYFRDYMFATVTCVPILLFYYTLIRNEYNKKKLVEQSLELEKIKAAKLETDMKLLKNQYHPHFLFNALNTIYFQVEDRNVAAKESIELLSGLLRYQLYNSDRPVTLEEEIGFLQSYIRFQQLRADDEISVNFQVEMDDGGKEIHPLLFHPLVENAFKYVDGKFRIDININQQVDTIIFHTSNTITGYPQPGRRTGIGLINLQQRLSILYPGKYDLVIGKEQGIFNVTLTLEIV